MSDADLATVLGAIQALYGMVRCLRLSISAR